MISRLVRAFDTFQFTIQTAVFLPYSLSLSPFSSFLFPNHLPFLRAMSYTRGWDTTEGLVLGQLFIDSSIPLDITVAIVSLFLDTITCTVSLGERRSLTVYLV